MLLVGHLQFYIFFYKNKVTGLFTSVHFGYKWLKPATTFPTISHLTPYLTYPLIYMYDTPSLSAPVYVYIGEMPGYPAPGILM